MNKEELMLKLKMLKIPSRCYSIDDGLKIDAHIFEEVHGTFQIYYYDEKGQEYNRMVFRDQEKACKYFLKILKEENNLLK